jgi:putative ABC transport system permease protein
MVGGQWLMAEQLAINGRRSMVKQRVINGRRSMVNGQTTSNQWSAVNGQYSNPISHYLLNSRNKMLLNYLKIAVRNLAKNKTYSVINIFGLALGVAVSVLILMFVMHEYSYDKFHTNHKRIYRVLGKVKMGDNEFQMSSFSSDKALVFKNSDARIKDFVRILPTYDKIVMKSAGKGMFFEENFMFADPSFLKIFSFELTEGNPATVLEKPFTMVISERAASKYFGDADPIGKTLSYQGKHPLQITGILKTAPSNSSFNPDFLASISTYPQLSEKNKNNWVSGGIFNIYLLLDSEKSAGIAERNLNKKEGGKLDGFGSKSRYILEGLSEIHLGNNSVDGGNNKLITIFTGVAALILFLALFNYMSLTTARATLRAKEVGVRKVIGSGRGGLVKQFYAESVLLCTLAFALAFILVRFLHQPFYDLLDLHIDASFLVSPSFLTFLIALLAFTALAAGSYPALVLSGFAPLEVLKGRLGGKRSGAGVRKLFMVFQFTVSIALIISSLVVKDQLAFMQNKKLGLYKDQILTVPLTESISSNYFPLREEIGQQAGVENFTFCDVGLFKGYNMFFLKNEASKKDVSIVSMLVDSRFVETLGLKWKSSPVAESFKKQNYWLLNETAVKELGIKGDPVGQDMQITGKIGGVLKDFHFTSVQSGMKAMGIQVVNDTTNLLKRPGGSKATMYVRLDPKTNVQEKVAAIEKIFKKYDKEKPFEYYFLDDAFNETFKTEMRMSQMFSVFTGLAIFIACMGLFGLVTFTAESRTKEIGIRKVLGSSVAGIVSLLSKDFIGLVLVAIVLAIPVAYFLMDKWLQDFAYRIDIPVAIYLYASLLAIVIALVTISFQSIKAALMNPVKSLRSE